jgi:hypothetical protein
VYFFLLSRHTLRDSSPRLIVPLSGGGAGERLLDLKFYQPLCNNVYPSVQSCARATRAEILISLTLAFCYAATGRDLFVRMLDSSEVRDGEQHRRGTRRQEH